MTKKEFVDEWINNVKTSIWKNEVILDWQKKEKNKFEVQKAEEAIEKDKEFLKFLIKRIEK